ncbi:PA domain-containing protein [Micromonospora pisi]|uniref:PA domain-containing protein n=1 Tax=Micromonospora pisi TaxID=589240 RepID=A0A495JE05_9ACTN|nr:S8 family serine peptidase [Micromonospora pisi]RKR86758.1 PA domain-containing protein [Micromonospora pisi]
MDTSEARRPRSVRTLLAGTVLTALVLAAPLPAQARPDAANNAAAGASRYLIELTGDPVASYAGGVAGIAATRPAQGTRLDRASDSARDYREHLRDQRTKVLDSAGIARARAKTSFDTVFNGFSALLTPAEVAKLRTDPAVRQIFPDRLLRTQSSNSADFLKLTGPKGVWQQQFGDPTRAGEGTIIGVVDTGYWPENPSFAPLSEPRADQAVVDAKWRGTCDTGETGQIACNNKVIGARWYDEGGFAEANPAEFRSPRDVVGHGTHTASTAAGASGVPVRLDGQDVGPISGVAPGARLAVYKALWQTTSGGGTGSTIDIVHAIEDAVTDGVDVINFSAGYPYDDLGATDVAFYHAAAAGVFVAASSGNSGPSAGTVDNAWPWMTTVAASTQENSPSRLVTLGDGRSFVGGSVGTVGTPSTPLVDAVDAGLPENNGGGCEPGTLDPAKVTGRIVLCAFSGGASQYDRGKAVQEAGGVGMIIYNTFLYTTNPATYPVPTVYLDQAAGSAVKAYVTGTAGATAMITPGYDRKQAAPQVAHFSSNGPWSTGGGNLIKPDIAAPGQEILAAVSPITQHGENFAYYSGTSMAAPHVAGLAALIISKHQDWSPMAVKSALMTTAQQRDNADRPLQGTIIEELPDGGSTTSIGEVDPFYYGSGHVNPAKSLDPGLVFDSDMAQWRQFACGLGFTIRYDPLGPPSDEYDECDYVRPMNASDLNYPSVAVADVYGNRTVSRTVTNVSDKSSTYIATVKAPDGWRVKVTPKSFEIAPGQSATYQVEFIRNGAAYGEPAFGALTWKDQFSHLVRTPLMARALALKTPAEVYATTTKGSQVLPVTTGYQGILKTEILGFSSGVDLPFTISGTAGDYDPFQFNPLTDPDTLAGVAKIVYDVPAETEQTRVAIPSGSVAKDEQINILVFNGEGALRGIYNSDDAWINDPGRNYVYVVRRAAAPGAEQTPLTAVLNVHPEGPNAPVDGTVTVTPAERTVRPGVEVYPVVRWSGLVPGRHYAGVIRFSDGNGMSYAIPVQIEP